MHSALALPEIQQGFCVFLAPPDAAALARTSPTFFLPAIQQLWGTNNVPVQYLLALLDGVTVAENGGLRMDLAEDFSEAHFTRFDIYAPHVKHLVSNHFSERSGGSTDCRLITPLAKSRVLLPNLVSLKVMGNKEGYRSIYYVEPPSLRALKIYNTYGWTLQHRSVGLIRKALSGCPKLELLWSTSPLSPPLRIASSELSMPLHMGNLTVHGSDLTRDVLIWMATMPCLKTLRLGDYSYPLSWHLESSIFPPNSFTVLKSLTVTLINAESATRLWSTPLVNNLDFARLIFFFLPAVDLPDAFEFFELLAKRSPNLTSLSLAFRGHTSVAFPARLLLLLSPLSLEFLEINGAQLQSDGENVFTQIAELWPLLRTLNLRDNITSLGDLSIIASSLSRLSRLSLKLDLESLPGGYVDVPPAQRFSQQLTFQTPLWDIYKRSLFEQNEFALYLARLWKNVKCVHPRKTKGYVKFLNRLNTYIFDHSGRIVD